MLAVLTSKSTYHDELCYTCREIAQMTDVSNTRQGYHKHTEREAIVLLMLGFYCVTELCDEENICD